MNLQTDLRPIDLAREFGLSTQAIRNYEDQGILPVAMRSESGYRRYEHRHVLALAAFLALVPGCGHARAAAILRGAHGGDIDEALIGLDAAHSALASDRETFRQVRDALTRISGPEKSDVVRRAFVGDVARRLGLVPATLRAWERHGIVAPSRDRATGYRIYSDDDVRDARIAHQLRRGGYSLDRIAEIVDQIRAAGGIEDLSAMLAGWQHALSSRGRALLRGAAALDAYLDAR